MDESHRDDVRLVPAVRGQRADRARQNSSFEGNRWVVPAVCGQQVYMLQNSGLER